MRRLAVDYADDIGDLALAPMDNYCRMVSGIPYAEDAEVLAGGPGLSELVARPKILLDRAILPRLDCKKKSILVAAYLQKRGLPWRFLAVSERPDKKIHHVYPELCIMDIWIPLDLTYPGSVPGRAAVPTYSEVI